VPGKLNVITGATGLLGSHVAEKLVARGEQVRALVRPASDVVFLKSLGIELCQGDLQDTPSIRRAVRGADCVYHCAAKVGDWGPWQAFQRETIDATRNLVAACQDENVGRLLHVSSITVYGHLPNSPGRLLTEEEPLGQNLWRWDNYVRAKIRAEEIVRQSSLDQRIIRPSWMYGPRDRVTLPRLLTMLRTRRWLNFLIGPGDNFLNIVYVGDVADAAILAASHPAARGQAFNLGSEGEVTQQDLVNSLTDILGMPRVTRHFPFRVAYGLGLFAEIVGRLIRLKRAPRITRYVVSLVGRPTQFSIAKARTLLGWRPRVKPLEGLRYALEYMGEIPAQASDAHKDGMPIAAAKPVSGR
jgi:nucleoside-diphosphate-sugar epimerase